MYNLQIVEERIMLLLKKQNLSKNKLLESSGLNKSVFDNMKKGQKPSIDKIHILADYLDCSVDYLLGRTDNSNSHKAQTGGIVSNAPINGDYNMNAGSINVNTTSLNSHQHALVELYNKLDPIQQAKLLALVSDIIDGKNSL